MYIFLPRVLAIPKVFIKSMIFFFVNKEYKMFYISQEQVLGHLVGVGWHYSWEDNSFHPPQKSEKLPLTPLKAVG